MLYYININNQALAIWRDLFMTNLDKCLDELTKVESLLEKTELTTPEDKTKAESILSKVATFASKNKYLSGNYNYFSGIISFLNKDYKGALSGADIHVSPDGKFLYASNRGELNNLVIYKYKNSNSKYWLKLMHNLSYESFDSVKYCS